MLALLIDLVLRNAMQRAVLGYRRSQELATPQGAEVVWDLLLLRPEDLADTTNPW